MGRPPKTEKEKLSNFSIRISPDLKEAIEKIAKAEGRSGNNTIGMLLRRAVKAYYEEHSIED